MVASQERLRLLVDNAREYAILGLDRDRRITSWNRGATMMLGYTAAEMQGASADILFTAEDRAAGAPQREAARAIEEERARQAELERQRGHADEEAEKEAGNTGMAAPVGLAQRAWPLLAMLEESLREETPVVWGV